MKYIVQTRLTVERTYEVDASDPKDAIAKSVDALPVHEEEFDEQTLSALPAVETSEVQK